MAPFVTEVHVDEPYVVVAARGSLSRDNLSLLRVPLAQATLTQPVLCILDAADLVLADRSASDLITKAGQLLTQQNGVLAVVNVSDRTGLLPPADGDRPLYVIHRRIGAPLQPWRTSSRLVGSTLIRSFGLLTPSSSHERSTRSAPWFARLRRGHRPAAA